MLFSKKIIVNFKLVVGSCRSRGFTLLFAALATSLLMSIGLVILKIAIKNAMLSGIAEQSQLAIYAADTGFECALYWDVIQNAFDPFAPVRSISCAGDTAFVGGGNVSPVVYTINLRAKYCADIRVDKQKTLTGGFESTVITADGFNSCDINNLRRVQRTLEVRY